MDISERIVGINSQVFEIKLNLRLKELETPSNRLDRARRLILRMMDIRDAVPLFTHNTTAHTAEKNLGRSYALCVALGMQTEKWIDRVSSQKCDSI